jgi:hypothetical protein
MEELRKRERTNATLFDVSTGVDVSTGGSDAGTAATSGPRTDENVQ